MSSLKFKHSSGNSMSIEAPATNPASNLALKLPATIGSANQVLKNSGTAGTLGWSTFVEDSNGNVGIGTSSPNSFTNYTTLTINGGSDGAGIDLELNDNNIYGRLFADATGLQIQAAQSGDSIRFETGGSTVRARITNDGLCFGTNTVAATALDDYEEGTWTPVPYLSYNPGGRSITLGTSSGSFTKIGRFVFLEYKFRWTAISGSGGYNVGVSGLPFSANNTVQATNGVGRSNMTGYTFVCENLYDTAIGVLRMYNNSSPNENEEIVGFASYFV